METAYQLSCKTGTKVACESLSLPRASFYRAMTPNKPAALVPANNPMALSSAEKQQVLDALHSTRFIDQTPYEMFATLIDEGEYWCSIRTMYRILGDNNEVKERRRGHRQMNYSKPELLATKPNQLWSWDITKLKLNEKWCYAYLYVILDVFSRYVVGWMVAERENATLAEKLIADTCYAQKIEPGTLTLHADRGSSMKSKTVAQLLTDLHIMKTHSRPHVSNDNPFSESQFKTLKYNPKFPETFGSVEDARLFCKEFFRWYNSKHHHSAIALLTPETVHYNKDKEIIEKRNNVLKKAFNKNPHRFKNAIPLHKEIPNAVWINKPTQNNNEENNEENNENKI